MENETPRKHSLESFPGQTAPDIRVAVEVSAIAEQTLRLWFVVSGQIDVIAKPALAQPGREDGLWQHTCFELFARATDQKGYCELNLSPSGKWAAYYFDDYRAGMRDLPIERPAINVADVAGMWAIGADVKLPQLPITSSWRLNLSAIIEEKDGTKSYWALAHPPGEPDFHDPDCFVLQLPAPRAS